MIKALHHTMTSIPLYKIIIGKGDKLFRCDITFHFIFFFILFSSQFFNKIALPCCLKTKPNIIILQDYILALNFTNFSLFSFALLSFFSFCSLFVLFLFLQCPSLPSFTKNELMRFLVWFQLKMFALFPYCQIDFAFATTKTKTTTTTAINHNHNITKTTKTRKISCLVRRYLTFKWLLTSPYGGIMCSKLYDL